MNLTEIPRERIADLLDSPVAVSRELVRSAAGRPLARAHFVRPEMDPAAVAQSGAELTSVWATLRSLPSDADLVINQGADGELMISADDAEALLGGSRATASTVSFRTRARLAARWVIVHVGPTGRFAGTVPGPDGRPVVPAWTDESRAQKLLPSGANLRQTPLVELLSVLDEFDVGLDLGTPGQLLIDRILGADLLATEPLFPRGFLAAVGHLEPRTNADYLDAAAKVAADALAASVPLAGLWVIGYQLEDAPSRIVYVADSVELEAVADLVVTAVEQLAGGRRERVDTVLLSSLSPETADYVRRSTQYVMP